MYNIFNRLKENSSIGGVVATLIGYAAMNFGVPTDIALAIGAGIMTLIPETSDDTKSDNPDPVVKSDLIK